MEEKLDLCTLCENHWNDFPLPLERLVSHCLVIDRMGTSKTMDELVPYPCVKCPFDSFYGK